VVHDGVTSRDVPVCACRPTELHGHVGVTVSCLAVPQHPCCVGGGCSPGYICNPGSSDDVSRPCTPGQFSTERNSSVCQQCGAGRFGDAAALASSNCSGLCPAGQFSLQGSPACSPCPGGRYGAVDGMSASSCSGVCTAGYECPPASTNSTATACVAGRYSREGADSCSVCPEGHYCTVTASGGAPCGGEPPGYYCLEGSVSARGQPCPPGQFSTGKGTAIT
jgi:hypothetical protein